MKAAQQIQIHRQTARNLFFGGYTPDDARALGAPPLTIAHLEELHHDKHVADMVRKRAFKDLHMYVHMLCVQSGLPTSMIYLSEQPALAVINLSGHLHEIRWFGFDGNPWAHMAPDSAPRFGDHVSDVVTLLERHEHFTHTITQLQTLPTGDVQA